MAAEVQAVLVEHGTEHETSALEALHDVVVQAVEQSPHRIAVVDNALTRPRELELAPRVDRLSGDNSWREFSGWDSGLRFLESFGPLQPDTVLVLANDTLHRSYGSEYLQLFTPELARPALERGALVGYMDAYPQEVTLFGLKVQTWIRTSLVIGRYDTLCRLRPFALRFEEQEVFSNDWRTVFREPSPLSQNYRKYLATWLWGAPAARDGFSEAWHSQRALSPESFELFKGKIRSILCEHALSARAQKLGIELVDVRIG